MRRLPLLALLLACAPNETPIVRGGYSGKPPLGSPITESEAPAGTWAWVPFPDASCGDGSTTGLGVRRGTGRDLLVFFDGGGACWDYTGCAGRTAFDKHYGPDEFAVEVRDWFPGSITDPAVLPAEIADATLVFVPYCTADVHGGDRTATYRALGGYATEVWQHVGHRNVLAYLERLAATWPSPRKLVVAGSSAGGFGALANYEAFRWYWPQASGYLVDDSGPPLVGDDISSDQLSAWYNAWNLGVALDPFCVECRTDVSAGITALSQLHRGDRIAFLSHLNDAAMTLFLAQPLLDDALWRLAGEVFEPTQNARVFYDAGPDHMLLLDVAAHDAGGTTLSTWLERLVSDDPAWGNELDGI